MTRQENEIKNAIKAIDRMQWEIAQECLSESHDALDHGELNLTKIIDVLIDLHTVVSFLFDQVQEPDN